METKRTEFISPVITLPNGNTTIIAEVRQEMLKNENNPNQSHTRPNNGTRKANGTIR